jgi:hypothetical protein
MKPVMCLVLLVFFMRQCKQHVLQMTSSAVGEPSILGSVRDLHDFWLAISGYFLQIWRYEHPVVTGRNRLTIWTEKSVGPFFSYFVSFSNQALHLLIFFGDSLLPKPYSIFLNYYWIFVHCHDWNPICMFKDVRPYVYAVRICIRLAKNITFGTPIKTVTWSRLSFSKCSKIIIAIGS